MIVYIANVVRNEDSVLNYKVVDTFLFENEPSESEVFARFYDKNDILTDEDGNVLFAEDVENLSVCVEESRLICN